MGSQVLFSLWMFMEGWGFYISGNYSWHCEPVDYSESPVARRALNLAWWYYFSKFIDLFDSVFFVLKKKFAHLSPLHVIHHSTLPFLCWWGTGSWPTGTRASSPTEARRTSGNASWPERTISALLYGGAQFRGTNHHDCI